MVLRSIRARYPKGVLEPLEEFDLEEGAEVSVSIKEARAPKHDPEAMRAGAGGWKGNSDPEELKRMIYEARIAGSREPPDP